ncbi:MAG: hypothetical protein KGH93_01055 [Patescibacteria group bacterium]|nr:hypothetical protein [Patescibacteria group bacterium]MDE1945769.1 hypothetical protein [Patescibacteria group bacterium]
MQAKPYKILGTKKLPDSLLEIRASVAAEALEPFKEKAFRKIKDAAELPGFRKGNVPDSILREKIGELGLLEEAADEAIHEFTPEIVLEAKANFLGRPEIRVTKIAPGTPVEFSITLTVMPEAKLPDYKKIAKKENAKKLEIEAVTDKQVDDTIEEIRRMYANQNHSHKDGEKHSADEKQELPEITDAFVKKLGDFKDVADFRMKLKDNIAKEKEMRAKDRRRGEILEKLVAETKADMPAMLIESELAKMEGQFKADIARMGLQPEEYLKHIKKSWDDLKKEWRPDAEKRAKTEILLQKIAIAEKIEPNKEEMEREVKHLMETYKDASEDRVRAYVEMILVNEAVIKFLEEIR